MSLSGHGSDEELLHALSAGDGQAAAELVRRHARGVHDFVLRGVMDEAKAILVTKQAFRHIAERTIDTSTQIDFRTWLYSVALVEVLAIVDEPASAPLPAADARLIENDGGFQREVASWAWQAAREQRTRDYCVLDLTLRRGLTPEEVADAASLTRNNLYASIGRARGAFEETYAATVLHRRGRAACPALRDVVASTTGELPRASLRHAITEHADLCDVCRKTLAALPPASSVFVALRDVALPDALQPNAAVPPAGPASGSASTVASASLMVPSGWGKPGGRDPDEPPIGTPRAAEALGQAGRVSRNDDQDLESRTPDFDMPARPSTRAFLSTTYEVNIFDDTPYDVGRRDRVQLPRHDYEGTLSDRMAGLVRRARGLPVLWGYVLLGSATVLAIYLGIAVADSLQGGGGSSGAVPLESTPGAAGRSIDCIDEAISLDHHNTSTTVSFAADVLEGYEIADVAITPISGQATEDGLQAVPEDTHTVRFEPERQQSAGSRVDAYQMRITWTRGDEVASSVCDVEVRITAAP